MSGGSDGMRAIVVLDPSESKRLIARAVAALPEVEHAKESGRLIIGHGTTNAFVAEEILGETVSKWRYSAGIIAGGKLDVSDHETRLPPFAVKEGKPFEGDWTELLKEFEGGDVFIKGGNAVDVDGNVGVLLGSPVGGTVGQFFGIIAARGAHLVAPIGLEKLVPDVVEAAQHCGTRSTDLCDGLPSGMAILPNPLVVTELEAFEVLFGVSAWHISSGGIAGSEGSVTIAIEGSPEAVRAAFEYTELLSSEMPVGRE
jgi:hypothetical protein